MSGKDYQRSKVYAWEMEHVPLGREYSFDEARERINEVWAKQGLSYPPLLAPLAKQTRKWAGRASRTTVYLPERTYERVILHELAHSMTATFEGHTDSHGPNFVGIYMKLLYENMECNLFELWYTARLCKVDFEINPVIRVNMVGV